MNTFLSLDSLTFPVFDKLKYITINLDDFITEHKKYGDSKMEISYIKLIDSIPIIPISSPRIYLKPETFGIPIFSNRVYFIINWKVIYPNMPLLFDIIELALANDQKTLEISYVYFRTDEARISFIRNAIEFICRSITQCDDLVIRLLTSYFKSITIKNYPNINLKYFQNNIEIDIEIENSRIQDMLHLLSIVLRFCSENIKKYTEKMTYTIKDIFSLLTQFIKKYPKKICEYSLLIGMFSSGYEMFSLLQSIASIIIRHEKSIGKFIATIGLFDFINEFIKIETIIYIEQEASNVFDIFIKSSIKYFIEEVLPYINH